MNAGQLFKAGKLNEAVQALSAELRDNPADTQRRTFLFELLCFSGAYDRAEKHLDVLAQSNKDTQLGALLYAGALSADRTRTEMFQKKTYPKPSEQEAPALTGTLNGKPFTFFEDADPRLGAKMEVFAAGNYMWLPMEHIASIEMEAPKRLRDLLWVPALIRTGPGFKERELGEVLLPVLTPLAHTNADDAVRLGRVTVWEEADGVVAPAGQRCFLVDDEEFPILEIRSLEFQTPETAANEHAAAE
ncbi:MAG TPA: type VI secretion system accessory protein TagJ [Candidatus Sulfopaludibacter sp.]|jgi:type VI secretion system protein ImpE|nr:type VI secretion system accessory protein TagJ [Candidatus Sulfopaludibacter sp.]